MRRIRTKVEFKESPILSDVRRVKQHLMYARSLLTSDIRTKLTEDSTVDLALETEGAGIEKEEMYLFGEVDFEKEEQVFLHQSLFTPPFYRDYTTTEREQPQKGAKRQ